MDVFAMVMNYMGGIPAMGLSYACALLQLQLGVSLAFGAVSVMAAAHRSSLPHAKPSADGVLEAVPRVVEDAGRHLLLLAVFVLLQVPDGAEGIGIWTMCFLTLSIFGYFVSLFFNKTDRKVLRLVTQMFHIIPTIPLLFTAMPGGVQLAVASAVARLALILEVAHASAVAFGLEEVLAEACADAKDALQLAPVLGGLAILEHMAWGASSILTLPVQPIFYCALGLASQVAIVLVLHFACGGGLKNGSAACDRIGFLNRFAKAGIALGILGSIASATMGLFELSLSRSGIAIQWGEPAIAAAIILAKVTLLAQIFEFFAPEPQKAHAKATNGIHTEANGQAEPRAELAEGPPRAAAGLSDALKSITSRTPGLILALVAMQMNTSEGSSDGLLKYIKYFMDFFSAPFRAGFLLCTCATVLQVFMVFGFSAYHCDVVPAPAPPLDVTGTLRWLPESKTGRQVIGMLRSLTLLLLHAGLFLGILGLGPLALPLALPIVFFVPKQGKFREQISEAISYSTSCCGIIDDWMQAYDAKRNAVAEAAAAIQAQEILGDEDKENLKKERKTTGGSVDMGAAASWKSQTKKAGVGSKKKKF